MDINQAIATVLLLFICLFDITNTEIGNNIFSRVPNVRIHEIFSRKISWFLSKGAAKCLFCENKQI